MTGCCVSWKCLVACLPVEESQQPTWPHDWHSRRATQKVPSLRHSSQASGVLCGGKSAGVSPDKCSHGLAIGSSDSTVKLHLSSRSVHSSASRRLSQPAFCILLILAEEFPASHLDPPIYQFAGENSSSSFRAVPRLLLRDEEVRGCACRGYRVG
jgi:hypothetical protein